MKPRNIDKVLRKHFDHCRMHEYSLQENRHCTCGVEGARTEMEVYEDVLEWMVKAEEWFQRQDKLDKNSTAVLELENLVRRAKDEGIIR